MNAKEIKYGPIIADKKYIKRIIDDIGFCSKYKGYYFLIYMVDVVLKSKVRSFSKELYPQVAVVFNVRECSIERDIRNLIKVSDINMEKLNVDKVKKSCRFFVNLIADCVVRSLLSCII